MKTIVACAALWLSLLLTCALPARALDLVPLSLDQLIADSPRIVVATCTASETRAVKAYGGNPFTFTRFDHVEALTGDLHGHFELRVFGGRSGDVRVWEDGLPNFVLGSRYLLFLGPSNKDGFPLLKPQGVFEILKAEGTDGSERLRGTLDARTPDMTLAQIRARVLERRKPNAAAAGTTTTPIRSREQTAPARAPTTPAGRQVPAP